MKLINTKKESGFSILAIILVIVAVIVAIGVWALSGQSNSSNSQGTTSDIQASSALNDINIIASKFDSLVISGYNPERIVFKPEDAAAPEGMYVYSKSIKGNQIGTEKDDFGIVLAGVKSSICKRLNYTLYGSENIPKLSGVANSAAFVSNATAVEPTTTATLDLAGNDAVVGWTNGCVASGSSDSDQNLIFKIVKPN